MRRHFLVKLFIAWITISHQRFIRLPSNLWWLVLNFSFIRHKHADRICKNCFYAFFAKNIFCFFIKTFLYCELIKNKKNKKNSIFNFIRFMHDDGGFSSAKFAIVLSELFGGNSKIYPVNKYINLICILHNIQEI